MPFELNPDLNYGWFSVTEEHKVHLYLKDLNDNKPDDLPYVLDAIFQLIHILGQTLPHDVDVLIDWETTAPISKCKITPLPLVEGHPVDQMHKFLGPAAQAFFPLAKLILYAHSHLLKVE